MCLCFKNTWFGTQYADIYECVCHEPHAYPACTIDAQVSMQAMLFPYSRHGQKKVGGREAAELLLVLLR